MAKFDFEQMLLMAKDANQDGLKEFGLDFLAEAFVMLYNRYDCERVERPRYDEQIYRVNELRRNLLENDEQSLLTSRIHDVERQLTETEKERDNLQDENEELENTLHRARKRIAKLEQKLASVPKVGRPDKYDAKFRAEVRSYYEEGHTYRETAEHFNISTNTVGRFLKA